MGYDFVRYLGESLGGRVNAGLVYLFLAYQVVVSALVFLFDSDFPPWLVIASWVAFMLLLALQAFRAQKNSKKEAEQSQGEEQQRRQLIARLRERLETDPGLMTLCRDCRNGGAGNDPCRVHAIPAEREFRFRRDDPRSYCLLWSPGEMAVENEERV